MQKWGVLKQILEERHRNVCRTSRESEVHGKSVSGNERKGRKTGWNLEWA